MVWISRHFCRRGHHGCEAGTGHRLFAANWLSLGKAAELAGLPVAKFQKQFGTRHLAPHHDADDAREDQKTLAALRGK